MDVFKNKNTTTTGELQDLLSKGTLNNFMTQESNSEPNCFGEPKIISWQPKNELKKFYDGTSKENSYHTAMRSIWLFGTSAETSISDINIPMEFEKQQTKLYTNVTQQ